MAVVMEMSAQKPPEGQSVAFVPRGTIYDEIARERLRQDTLKAEGRFRYTLADEPGLDDGEKLAALLEEVAEVGKAMLGERMLVQDGGNKRKELIEVAVAVAWVEGIDAWKGRRTQ